LFVTLSLLKFQLVRILGSHGCTNPTSAAVVIATINSTAKKRLYIVM
jgi:hypothetical protein